MQGLVTDRLALGATTHGVTIKVRGWKRITPTADVDVATPRLTHRQMITVPVGAPTLTRGAQRCWPVAGSPTQGGPR